MSEPRLAGRSGDGEPERSAALADPRPAAENGDASAGEVAVPHEDEVRGRLKGGEVGGFPDFKPLSLWGSTCGCGERLRGDGLRGLRHGLR